MRRLLTTLAAAALALPALAALVAAQPANDDFANAETIAALPFAAAGDTTDAGGEAGEPSPCGGTANTVWYSYTAAADGLLVADTFGSAFDTVLAVYTGADLAALETVRCSDDAADTLQSRAYFPGAAGTTYWIQVGGFDGDTGAFVLNLDESDLAIAENDDRADAVAILATPFAHSTATVAATVEDDEPAPSCAPIGATVWYAYMPFPLVGDPLPHAIMRAHTLGSSFDTVVAVYAVNPLDGGLVQVGCDDDGGPGLTSELVFPAAPGATHFIQVGGFGGDSGILEFELQAVV